MKNEPAFPAMHFDLAENEHGMTLRDYFAAKTMQYWLCHPISLDDADRCARNAYSMADAMLKARNENN
jgi:hypothetical protein